MVDIRRRLGDQIRPWNFKLTGDSRLTQTTGAGEFFQPIFHSLCPEELGTQVFFASIFVVPIFRDGTDRTPGDTFPAFFVSKVEAIFPGMTIPSLRGYQLQKEDDTSDAHGHSLGCDETVIETEGPETTNKGDMPL